MKNNKRTILRPGDRFGLWTVIKEANPVAESGERRYLCRCECGRESAVRVQKLISGLSTSCGKCGASSMKIITSGKLNSANRSGHAGVHWNRKDQRWEANVTYRGQRRYLGQYIDKEDAIKAREAGVAALEREVREAQEEK